MDESNKRRVLDEETGEYITKHTFSEAFQHHVNYVYCRAKGTFSSNLGKKPEFCEYVRGAHRFVLPNDDCIDEPSRALL